MSEIDKYIIDELKSGYKAAMQALGHGGWEVGANIEAMIQNAEERAAMQLTPTGQFTSRNTGTWKSFQKYIIVGCPKCNAAIVINDEHKSVPYEEAERDGWLRIED